MEGETNDDYRYGVLANHSGQGFQIAAQILTVDSHERLGGVAKRIGEGQAYAAVTHIQRQDAGHD